MDDALLVEPRLDLLTRFLGELHSWRTVRDALKEAQHSQGELRAKRADIESRVNRMVIAVKQALDAAGVDTGMNFVAPAVAGGQVLDDLDMFDMIFTKFMGHDVLPHVVRRVEQGIGVYESLKAQDGLARTDTRQAIDILTAIERALRPAFRAPPPNEKAVQDEIETILRAVGVDYHREAERAPVGPTTFIPDFTVEADGLAIEVKLATETHGAAKIQREIAEDVAAYGTKWRRIFFVVYDCGVIQDPDQLRRENQKHFGVRVLIVKH